MTFPLENGITTLFERLLAGTISEEDAARLLQSLESQQELSEAMIDNLLVDFLLHEKYDPVLSDQETRSLSLPVVEPRIMTDEELLAELVQYERNTKPTQSAHSPSLNEKKTGFFRALFIPKPQPKEKPNPQPDKQEAPARKQSFLPFAIRFILFFSAISWLSWQGGREAEFRSRQDYKEVASIVETIGAVWGDNTVSLKRGQRIGSDHFFLKSGLVKLLFDNGTEIVVQGPGEYMIKGPSCLFCANGHLSASVSHKAKGFEIGTPFTKFIDRGTEFSITVDHKTARLDVIKGRVDAVSDLHSPALNISTGHACQIDGKMSAVKLKADPSRYVSQSLFHRKLMQDIEQQDEKESQQNIKRDNNPHLLARFDFTRGFDGIITNHSVRGAILCPSLRLFATDKGEGNRFNTRAIRFSKKESRAEWSLDVQAESITMMAVVRIDSLKNYGNVLYTGKNFYQEQNHLTWQISNDGRLSVMISREQGANPYTFTSPPVIMKNHFGCWAKLGVVFNGNAKTITHYYDGKAVASTRWPDYAPLKIGDSVLGNMIEGNVRINSRNFDGAMASFYLYDQPLRLDQW